MAMDDKQEQYGTDEGFSEAESAYEAPYVIRHNGSETIPEQKPEAKKKTREESELQLKIYSKSKSNIGTAINQKSQKTEAENDYSVFEDYIDTHSNKKLSKAEKKAIAKRKTVEKNKVQRKFSDELDQGLSQYIYQGLNQEVVTAAADTMDGEQRRRTHLKPFLGVGFGLLLAVLTWLLFTKLVTDTDYHYIKADAIEVFTDINERTTYVFTGSGDILYKLPEVYNSYYTSDHTSAILFSPTSRKCHVVNQREDYEIFSPILGMALSDDGNYALYSVEGGMGKYFLYLFNLEKHSETLLDNQENRQYGNMYVAPGGGLCFYTTYPMNMDELEEGLSSYIIKDQGKPELIGKNQVLKAYSREQQILYLCSIKEDGTATYSKSINGISTVLSNHISNAVFYNEDYSELLIEENGSYRLWTDKGECIPISDKIITGVLLPPKVKCTGSYHSLPAYGFSSFRNKLLITEDNKLLFIASNDQTKVIATGMKLQNTVLSRDGRTLLYCNQEGNLIRVTDFEGECEQ